MVTAGDAARVHVDLAELREGRELLVRKCGGACHLAPVPADHAAAEWPGKLDEMSARAGLKPEQRQLIEMYLTAMAEQR